MKKPKRKKSEPKFCVGQVVCLKKHNIYYRIWRRWTHENFEPFYGLSSHADGAHESKLRPLTAKEIGPRRKRG